MRKSRVRWLRKHFGPHLDPENPKGDFRKVKKWWNKIPAPEKQELVHKTSAVADTFATT